MNWKNWKTEVEWFFNWWIKGVDMAADNDPSSAWSWDESKEIVPDPNYEPYDPYTIKYENYEPIKYEDFMNAVKYLEENSKKTVGWKGVWNTAVYNDEWLKKALDSYDSYESHPAPYSHDVDKFDHLLEGK